MLLLSCLCSHRPTPPARVKRTHSNQATSPSPKTSSLERKTPGGVRGPQRRAPPPPVARRAPVPHPPPPSPNPPHQEDESLTAL